ncbi:MAG TPA: excinuclease ABC subunit UvrB, partial [Elusimicrobiota bacterium]|nr:excinuclease ABC subunit UvrB [Elusimicrobiota bacterium]
MSEFKLVSPFTPSGDQPQAIKELIDGVRAGRRHQVLLGVTGSGKTFTAANVIAAVQKPTLVLSPNKILAAQLYAEFKQFFPENAVEYFISYYDYYQPEAYVPSSDTYIEKDSSVNDHIDRLRLKATSALLERSDVIVVASVSCIYGLGSPENYRSLCVGLSKGQSVSREALLSGLVNIQYERNEIEFSRAKFRVRGDTVEIFPAYLETALRVEFWGDEIEKLSEIDPLTGRVLREKERTFIYPARHFVTTRLELEQALKILEIELRDRLAFLRNHGKLVEAQRLEQRTRYDMEMMSSMGFCNGIENYSRPLSGRPAGSRPACLLDYFPKDFLAIIDESHVSLPQVNGMYEGDRSRKQTLVDYGFRLPCALDNRPLRFSEFEALVPQFIHVSATPGPYELKQSGGVFVEQVIRPTGLVDPRVEIRPVQGQIDDLIKEVEAVSKQKERVLVTTLTKRMAEDLTEFLKAKGLRVRYLHSEIDALQRIEILRDLRRGEFDALIGINLLREGLDLPEVSLVAILDADKEGFLRSETTLIQVCGRAARNINGRVLMYADQRTGSMKRALDEMERRRSKQEDYNMQNGITPRSIVKSVQELEEFQHTAQFTHVTKIFLEEAEFAMQPDKLPAVVQDLEKRMLEAADNLQFE